MGTSTIDAPVADAPNVVWAVNFQFDVCEQGRALKMCLIVDQHTRDYIGGLIGRSITADRFIDHLEELIVERGAPAVLRSDNGPEFIANPVTDWAAVRTALSSIPPGQP